MTNTVRLRGIVRDPFYLEDREDDGTCYVTYVSVMRNSGIFDTMQVVIPASVLDEEVCDCTGREIFLIGEFRSRNRFDGLKRRLELFVFATSMKSCDEYTEHADAFGMDTNYIHLVGTVCRPAAFRLTPSGRRITDFLLAVNRSAPDDYRSDYIPCICWQEDAERYADLKPGDCVELTGRAQSRQYVKTQPDGRHDVRVAYEVSVKRMLPLGRVEDLQKYGKVLVPSDCENPSAAFS